MTGFTDSEQGLESLGESTTLQSGTGYSSTSSLESDLHPAQVIIFLDFMSIDGKIQKRNITF